MSDGMETNTGRGKWLLTGLTAVMAIVTLAASVYMNTRIGRLKGEVAELRAALQTDVTGLRQSFSDTVSANQQTQHLLLGELAAAKRQVNAASGRARSEAVRHADQLAKALAQEQESKHQRVATELTAMKEAAGAAGARIAEMSTEVTQVKSSVDETKSGMEKAIAELKSVRGDLGVQSGLIATNGKELAALRALGERNYYEFDLRKAKQPQTVSGISLALKKADRGRNRYTLDVIADDKKIEKKEKGVNEPVQFYVSRSRQPWEIVVNEVQKDRIIGYLATPKVEMARR